jgi:photosystem II stability/assembly factor-like uncharacterized protein
MKKKAPVGYYSTHKARSVWFEQAAAFPMRDADPTQVERRMFQDPSAPPQQWEAVGPVNFAGRVTSLAIHPKSGMLFAGSAAGGVWRSRDLGKTWLQPSNVLRPPIGNTDPRYAQIKGWPTNNIGALAIDPHNPDHILAATGEANGSADSYPGCGIFHSLDSGETWQPLAFTEDTGLPRRIGVLAVDPTNPLHIVAGGITHVESEAAGIFFSLDGGLTWGVENFINKPYYCHAVVFSHDGRMLVAIDARGTANGLWSSLSPAGVAALNAVSAWTQLGLDVDPATGSGSGQDKPTLPDGIRFGRTSLAVAPSQPKTIYAFAGNRRGGVLGLFRTDDGGRKWRNLAGKHFADEQQTSYTSCIAVHPEDPDFVVAGGLDVHVSADGGKTWRHATSDSAPPGSPNAVHGDHHALLVLKDGTIVTACDGGVYVSANRGRSWTARTLGMQTTMFYAMDVAPTNPNSMGGGCQDSGTLVRDDRDKPGHFRNVIGGDGAWLVYDPEEAENIFGGYHEAHIYRHLKGHKDAWVSVNPPIKEVERKRRAIAVMAIDPVRRKGRRDKYVYLGTDRLWRTTNWGESWKPVSAVFDGSPVSAIAIAPDDPDFLLVGTTRGGIYRSTDGAKTWSENFAGAEIPMRLISAIAIFSEPGRPRTQAQITLSIHSLCTVAGTGLGAVPIPKLFRPRHGDERIDQAYSHVFGCLGHGEDGWKDADGGRLPDMAYQCCAFESNPPHRVFIGGDFGVFMGSPAGFQNLEQNALNVCTAVADSFQWTNITGNLPNVIVSDLVYHHANTWLYASTYGRGIWRLKMDQLQP